MKCPRIAISLVIFQYAGVTGCASYHDPVIRVTDARVTEITNEAVAVRFGMDLHNPNDEALTLLEFDYDVSINGKHAYSGMRAAETVLAIQGDKHVEIPAVIHLDATLPPPESPENSGGSANAMSYSINGSLRYITPGKIMQILFDTGVRKPSAGFRSTGEIQMTSAAATTQVMK
jgi:hypothetical protein